MGRFVTPQGVVIEMDAEAAQVVGYTAAADKSADKKPAPKKAAEKPASKSEK